MDAQNSAVNNLFGKKTMFFAERAHEPVSSFLISTVEILWSV